MTGQCFPRWPPSVTLVFKIWRVHMTPRNFHANGDLCITILQSTPHFVHLVSLLPKQWTKFWESGAVLMCAQLKFMPRFLRNFWKKIESADFLSADPAWSLCWQVAVMLYFALQQPLHQPKIYILVVLYPCSAIVIIFIFFSNIVRFNMLFSFSGINYFSPIRSSVTTMHIYRNERYIFVVADSSENVLLGGFKLILQYKKYRSGAMAKTSIRRQWNIQKQWHNSTNVRGQFFTWKAALWCTVESPPQSGAQCNNPKMWWAKHS